MNDESSTTICEIQLSASGQTFKVMAGLWEDPAAWGILIADLIREVSEGYAKTNGGEVQAYLSRIKAGLDAELGSN